MRGSWRAVALLAGLWLFASACTQTTTQATNSPESSPSTQASPSESPSTGTGNPSPSAAASPSTSPSGPALAIDSLPFHNGEVGIGYLAVTLGATGGAPPYEWSVGGGTFPPGLGLSSDGVVTGTNTTAGNFTFTVKVRDSAGASATSPGGFGVFSAMTVTQPCASQCVVGAGCARCGGFGAVKGGLGPYTYKVVGGFVPDGMTLSGLSLKGPFPQSPLGAFNLSVQVTDQFTATGTVNASWYVYNPATLSSNGDCLDPNFTGACTTTLSYSGGNGTVPPKVNVTGIACDCSNATLPPIWTVAVKGGTVSISAGLNPNTCTSYFADVTLQLADTSACATTFPSNPVVIRVNLNNCG